MNRRNLFLVLLPLLAFGCQGKEEEKVDVARMFGSKSAFRMVNLTDQPMTAVYDEHNLGRELQFGDTTGFMLTRPGERSVTASLPSGAKFDEKVEVPKGETRTLYAVVSGGKPQFLLEKGDPRIGEEGKVQVRVVNLADGPEATSITIGSSAVPGSLGKGQSSEVITVDPGNHDIAATVGGEKLSAAAYAMEGGRAYTVVFAKRSAGAKPELVVVVNNPKMQMSMGGATPTG